MLITDFYIATTLSVLFGILVDELFGINPGGVIVPGVLALHFYSFSTLIAIILISIITYMIVEYGVSKHIILFGKRKFSAMILVALLLKIVFDVTFPYVPFEFVAYRGIGAITPAILANTYSKQGISYTLPTTIIVSAVIFFIVNFI